MRQVLGHDVQRTGDARRGVAATAGLLVASWVGIVVVVVGVGWLITHPWSGPVDSFDNRIARWFADERTPALSDLAEVGTFFGETIVSLVLSPIIAVGLWIWRRSVVPALFVGLVVSGIGGIYFVATSLDPRQRPPVKILDAGLVPDHSFPSGHVGTATALFGLIVVLVWTYARAVRWWALPLLVLPLAVLLARLYQGAHHLTDVLTSLVYTTVWLVTVAVLVLGGERRSDDSLPS